MPGGGELHAGLRARLRTAEKAGLAECVEEGVNAAGNRYEVYRLTERGETIVAGMQARHDMRDAGVE